MALIDTATIKINYTSEGPADAPVLMFSNSLGADLSMWQDQAAHFTGDYRVIRYDQRGHGRSEVPPGPYSFELLTDDVIALMDALDIERVHFTGLSMGGMTALGMALDHGDRVASITACNCVAGYGPDALKVWDDRIAAVSANGLAPILEGTLQRWFTQPTIDARPDDMAAVRAMILATPVDGYLGCCGAIKGLKYLDRLGEIDLPALFVAGTHDQGAPVAAVKDMHERVRSSRFVELETAHISNMERPAEFNAALGDFLRSA